MLDRFVDLLRISYIDFYSACTISLTGYVDHYDINSDNN